MFYIGIALAVAAGIIIANNWGKIFDFVGGYVKSYLIPILKFLAVLAIVGVVVYLCYRGVIAGINAIDWDAVLVIIIRLALIFGFIFGVGWLYKITHKGKSDK